MKLYRGSKSKDEGRIKRGEKWRVEGEPFPSGYKETLFKNFNERNTIHRVFELRPCQNKSRSLIFWP